MSLDSFVQSAKPPPKPLFTSQEIEDRLSVFVANIFRVTTEAEAHKAITYLKNVIHGSKQASHEMYAWRCMVLKPGKTGLGGSDDFVLRTGSDDDGEKYGAGRILRVMQNESVVDAVVVVSRWYGGELLGPARFAHIETCTREVCRAFSVQDEMEEHIATLKSLDDILSSLRTELAELTARWNQGIETPLGGNASEVAGQTRVVAAAVEKAETKRKHDYNSLLVMPDPAKAKRLVSARENAISAVKSSIKKAKDRQASAMQTGGS